MASILSYLLNCLIFIHIQLHNRHYFISNSLCAICRFCQVVNVKPLSPFLLLSALYVLCFVILLSSLVVMIDVVKDDFLP